MWATVAKIMGYVFMYHDEGTLLVSDGKKHSSFATAKFGHRQLTFTYVHDDGGLV